MADRPKTVLTARLGKEDAEAFDACLRSSPFAAYQQSRAWAENAPRRGRHSYLYFLCRQGTETIGAAVVRSTRLGPGGRLATLQRGPVVADLAMLPLVLAELKRALKQAGFASVVAGPRIGGEDRETAAEAMARAGFRPLPPQQQSLHAVTGTISLDGEEDALLARFRQRARRWIRKLRDGGLTVREANEADIPAVQALLDDFHARRPDYDASGQPDAAAQARIVGAEGGALLVAEEEGRIVGWHSFVRQGQDAIWLGLATDDDPKSPRSYLLMWEGLKRARAMGLRHHDLAGLSPDGAETGRDQFKNGFAPERVELLPAHVAALRPLRHAIFFNARQFYRAWRARRR